MQQSRGRSSSAFAFGALFVLCSAFAYLESRAFGHEVAIPMYGYILAAIVALVNLVISRFSAELYHHNLRLIGPRQVIGFAEHHRPGKKERHLHVEDDE